MTGTLATTFGGAEDTGRSVRIDQAVITHLRDGKIIEAWEIADIAALGAQVDDGSYDDAVDTRGNPWQPRAHGRA